jgi:hypothetical protein
MYNDVKVELNSLNFNDEAVLFRFWQTAATVMPSLLKTILERAVIKGVL